MESIHLPLSKSILNRYLILTALSGNANISVPPDEELPNDVRIMKSLLFDHNAVDNDVADAGTAFRFLTAYLSILPGTHRLYGTPHLNSRPIKPLVDALKKIGAKIKYESRDGYAPLIIEGKKLEGGEVAVDASVSSQFVSALMLIAPSLSKGLKIKMLQPTSRPYIQITSHCLNTFGAWCDVDDDIIEIEPCEQMLPGRAWRQPIESDWSSAAFWYALAVMNRTEFKLCNLSKESIQGDQLLMELFYRLGVASRQNGSDIEIYYQGAPEVHLEFDLKGCPDLAPAIIATCATRIMSAKFYGLENLASKESNRTAVMQRELKKLGRDFLFRDNCWELPMPDINWNIPQGNITLNPENDHRLAMAFACFKVINNEIKVLNPECVTKSYPGFWKEFNKVFHLSP